MSQRDDFDLSLSPVDFLAIPRLRGGPRVLKSPTRGPPHVGIENSAAPAQTARGNTGTGCRRVDGSELAPSFAPFEHIYTANAPELPNRTWV